MSSPPTYTLADGTEAKATDTVYRCADLSTPLVILKRSGVADVIVLELPDGGITCVKLEYLYGSLASARAARIKALDAESAALKAQEASESLAAAKGGQQP